jgi:hypothetical protein
MNNRSIMFGSVFIALTAAALAYPPGWEYSPPSAEDEYLTNRFGRSWSDPIYNGYLIVDSRYINAPYVVEQRGFVIFVNDVKVEDGADVRSVLPPPELPLVTEDPGLPTNLTRTSSIGEALMHPVRTAKVRYWNHLGLYGEKRIEAEIQFLSSMPCVSKVELTGNDGPMGTKELMVYDYSGKPTLMGAQFTPPTVLKRWTDEELYKSICRSRGSIEALLRSGETIIGLNGGLVTGGHSIEPNERWRAIVVELAVGSPREEKRARLRALGLGSGHGLDYARYAPNFHVSTQLMDRVSGNLNWTNNEREIVRQLTNRWHRVDPAFEGERKGPQK